jgi:hypothetical protein
MADWLTLVKMAQGWITSPRTMSTFSIGIAILLGLIFKIGHHDIAYSLDHYAALWFVLALCVAGLITHCIVAAYSRLKFRHRLKHLASDERVILNRFVEKDATTIHATFGEPAASNLAEDGILRVSTETGRVHQDVGVTYYSIPFHALVYLRKHKNG